MAKISSVQKNKKREKMAKLFCKKRAALKEVIYDKNISIGERFSAVILLARLPRNSAKTRIRSRCQLTGRPRGVYKKFGLSRNKLRELCSKGLVPGVVKASW